MSEQFKLPDLGEGVHEGRIVAVLVSEGQEVKEDVPLLEVETDKASVEIPCPHTGVIEKVHVEEGQMVHVGDVMVTFADGKQSAGAAPAQAKAQSGVAAAAGSSNGSSSFTAGDGAATATAVAKPPGQSNSGAKHKPASPAVRKYARTVGIDINTIEGSGPRGRVTKADVERASKGGTGAVASATSAPSAPPARTVPPPPAPPPTPYTSRAVPVASQLPEKGIDENDHYGPVRRHKYSLARKTIASNMYASWTSIPHVTDFDHADVTDLDKLRRGYASEKNGGRKITMLAFVVRAVAQALQSHPIFNAVFDAEREEIVYKRYINISIGVQTDRGLIAPVIRNVEHMGVAHIADALVEVSNKVRSGKFDVNELRGGTYTISNAGAFGGSWFSTPIISPGQSAVLAIGRSRKMPWVVEDSDEIKPRLIMPISHTFDHRLADGAQEVAFLRQVIGALENPARMLL